MPPRNARAYLWDAAKAVELLQQFNSGKSFADYEADVMLRSAVERQFEITGEALNQLSKLDQELAARIPDLPRIVAFRNILIHGYASVDDALVWRVLTDRVPVLRDALDALLGRAEA